MAGWVRDGNTLQFSIGSVPAALDARGLRTLPRSLADAVVTEPGLAEAWAAVGRFPGVVR